MTGRVLRFLLWLGVFATARAYHRKSPLLTAWAPHLVGNTFILWLPEIYRVISRLVPARSAPLLSDTQQVVQEVVVDNPRYSLYVAPPAIAFMLSYPGHNMYKSEWANRQLFGMGLDSIPHAVTAFALTQMLYDTLRAVRRLPEARRISALAAAVDRPDAVSAAVVAAVSIWYETSEFLIQRSELQATHGDEKKVVMSWSPLDSLEDLIANATGVAMSIWLNRDRARAGSRGLPLRQHEL